MCSYRGRRTEHTYIMPYRHHAFTVPSCDVISASIPSEPQSIRASSAPNTALLEARVGYGPLCLGHWPWCSTLAGYIDTRWCQRMLCCGFLLKLSPKGQRGFLVRLLHKPTVTSPTGCWFINFYWLVLIIVLWWILNRRLRISIC